MHARTHCMSHVHYLVNTQHRHVTASKYTHQTYNYMYLQQNANSGQIKTCEATATFCTCKNNITTQRAGANLKVCSPTVTTQTY